ncbi:MAG: sodium/solute symporter [Elusimicrobiota bacterium]|jgi:SSS family transporter
MSFGFLDGAVLAAYVAALASIGWWAAHRTHKTTDDYFLAGRSIPWLVTLASFLATCISALTFVGTPGEGYRADYRYLFSNIGDIAATFFVAGFILPVYQKLGVTSIYQYAAERFGPPVRTACSGYFLLSRTLASTVRIVAIAKVLEVVSGGSLPYSGCVVIVIGVILAYTTMGGGRAIAWTDLMQFILLISGAVIALVYIVMHVPGGVHGIIDAGRHAVRPDGTEYNKFNFLELFKPANLGLLLLLSVWGFFQSSAAYGTDQDMVQRLLACNDQRKARWSLMLSGLAGIPITFLFLSIGVALYAYSLSHPELVAGMKDPDHIFPRFILTTLPEGLRGLLLAAVASAAMGSSDSALASLSTAFTMDFYKRFWGQDASEERCVKVSKLSFVGFGLLFMFFALTVKNLDSLLWLAFKIVSFTYGPLLGVFLTAIFTDWKVPARRLIVLMLAVTLSTFALGMTAWQLTPAGVTEGFWAQLHLTYWRLYIIFGALAIPAGSYFLREKAPTTA